MSGGVLAIERSVDGWPRDGKNLCQIANGIVAGVVHAAQFLLLFGRQWPTEWIPFFSAICIAATVIFYLNQ
jgi:hypothetical protein